MTSGSATHGTLSVIDTTTHQVHTIPVVPDPYNPVITPNGRNVYMISNSSGSISAVNTLDNTSSTIPVGSKPFDIALTSNGLHAYVTNVGSKTASAIDTATNKVADAVRVGREPDGAMAISRDGRQVYVADGTGGRITVIHVGAR